MESNNNKQLKALLIEVEKLIDEAQQLQEHCRQWEQQTRIKLTTLNQKHLDICLLINQAKAIYASETPAPKGKNKPNRK